MATYELHQVEREAESEGWIWVRDKKLEETTHNRRPVLRLSYSSKSGGKSNSVCCETLWADALFLRNRRFPILIGTIKDSVSTAKFKVIDENGVATPVDASSSTKFKAGDATMLTNSRPVCVIGMKTDTGLVRALSVTFDFTDNLVFLSGWYRRSLGIDVEHGKIELQITPPKTWLSTMWRQLRACIVHPQIAVAVSTVLAFLGTGLGIIGLALGLIGLSWPPSMREDVALAVAACGLAVILLGFRLFYLRAKA